VEGSVEQTNGTVIVLLQLIVVTVGRWGH